MNGKISVIIPTLGRPTLAFTLEGLKHQTTQADEIHVVLDTALRGVGWARNEGLRRSSGDIIAFLDDDTIPPPHWLESMVAAMQNHGADGAGGSFHETDPFLHEIRMLHPPPDHYSMDGPGHVGNGGNLLLRRRVFDVCLERDGYWFVESWKAFGSEDWELIMRVRAYGFHLVYLPVHMQHLRRVTPRTYWRHQFKRGVGIFRLDREIRRRGMLPPQPSLLWDPQHNVLLRWLRIVAAKVVGPFTWRKFSRKRFFFVHWVAEKMQSLGYLWGMIRHEQ